MEKIESERNTLFSVILGFIPRIHIKHLTNVILGFIPRIHTEHLLNVILGFIPGIHAKHTLMDTRVKPEYDKDLERIETAESGVDKVVSSCEKNPNVHKTYMNFLRQRKTALDAPLHAVSSGRSMIEMLGVLAIIGVLSIGGIAGYTKAMETYKINKLKQAITEIVTNTRTLYASQNPQNKYQSLGNNTAKMAGILTDEMQSILKESGVFYVSGNNLNSYKTFLIELGWISEKECVALATADWGTTSSTGLYSLAIYFYSQTYNGEMNCDTTGEKNIEGGNKMYVACSGQLPLSPAIAAKYCALGTAEGYPEHSSFISLQFQ